jgi:Tol biopolymer transport system component
MDQGGGSQTSITSDAGRAESRTHTYRFPTWSPDGSKLAFVKLSSTSQGVESARVFTASPDGQDQVEAYTSDEQFPIYLYWSPDSQHVSFLTSAQTGSLLLQMVSAQGGEPRLLDAGAPFYWSWAPNGQHMLVHVGGDQPSGRLSFLSVNGDVVEEALSLRPGLFQAPAWSPDGNQVLLAARTDAGEPALMLTDAHGGVKNILKLLDGSTAFGWSPDGQRVAYIAGDPNLSFTIGTLTVIEPDQPAAGKTSDLDTVLGFFWSPDSKKVAYFELIIYAPTPEPGDTGTNEPISLFNLKVMDVASGESHPVAIFLPTDEFFGVMPYFDQYQHSATLWSPDSKNLVLSGYPLGNEPQQMGIWVIAASGGLEPRFLTEGTLAFWSWQ